MNPEAKEKWILALRSGEYRKGTHRLHRLVSGTSFYCVLGVLCAVASKEGVPMKVTVAPYSDDTATVAYDTHYTDLPPAVLQWADLNPEELQIEDLPLTYINDNLDYTFHELADLIEKHF